ncbi:MAG: DsrE family protein [Actinobacteria bacterium]|nr:DsrE family protein [Actinomycetota bacterium]MCL5883164.1 DsrE family protein [Actinomycetota bacterium]
MAKILAVATHGTDDPTRSSLAFIVAAGALEAGKEAAIALVGEGVYLAKKEIAQSIQGVAAPPLSDVIAKIVEGKVPVYL